MTIIIQKKPFSVIEAWKWKLLLTAFASTRHGEVVLQLLFRFWKLETLNILSFDSRLSFFQSKLFHCSTEFLRVSFWIYFQLNVNFQLEIDHNTFESFHQGYSDNFRISSDSTSDEHCLKSWNKTFRISALSHFTLQFSFISSISEKVE